MFQIPGRRADSLRIGRYTNFLDTTDNEQLTADGIASLIDIASIEKNVNDRYQRAIENHDYNEILGLFNDKSLVVSVGRYFGIDNKIYIDRAISLLEGDLRDELSEALMHYISH